MKVMISFLKSMASIWTLFLAIVSLSLLAGCAHKTTISEASTYMQVQSQQVILNSYKQQIENTRARLTEVIPEVANLPETMPESLLGKLTTFLANNDCVNLPQSDKEQCYKLTRIKLIEVTRQVDEANVTSYAARKTVQQLVDNINAIVDGLNSNTAGKELGAATVPTAASSP